MEKPSKEAIESFLSKLKDNAIHDFDLIIQSNDKWNHSHNYSEFTLSQDTFYRTNDEIRSAERIIKQTIMEALNKIFELYGYSVEPFHDKYNIYHICFIVELKKKKIAFGYDAHWNEDWYQIGSQNNFNVIEVISFKNHYGTPSINESLSLDFGGKDGVHYETNCLENISKKYLFDEWVVPLLFETINFLEIEFSLKISSITIDLPSPDKTYWFKKKTLERINHFNGYYTDKNIDYSFYFSKEEKEKRKKNEWTYITITDKGEKWNYSITEKYNLSNETKESLKKQFFDKGYWNILFGDSDFATSFFTSEWLFYSIGKIDMVTLGDCEKNTRKAGNFDYTAIVCGYLKSIEQLLLLLMKGRVNKGHVVKAKDNTPDNICIFKPEKNRDGKEIQKKYVALTEETLKYVKTELWYSEYFIKNTDAADTVLNVNDNDLNIIYSAIDDFRNKCRNGNFHVDNLYDWSKVCAIRNNALVLYFYILGSCNIDLDYEKTGIVIKEKTDYEKLCEIVFSLDVSDRDIIISMDGKEYFADINPFMLIANYSHDPIIYDCIPVTIKEFNPGEKTIDELIISKENLPDKIIFYRNFSSSIQIWEKGKH